MVYNLILISLFIALAVIFLLGSFSEILAIAILLIVGASFILLIRNMRKLCQINKLMLWFIGAVIFDLIVMSIASYRVTLAGGGKLICYIFSRYHMRLL